MSKKKTLHFSHMVSPDPLADSCALNPDGSLKEATEIEWAHSPSQEEAGIPRTDPASPSPVSRQRGTASLRQIRHNDGFIECVPETVPSDKKRHNDSLVPTGTAQKRRKTSTQGKSRKKPETKQTAIERRLPPKASQASVSNAEPPSTTSSMPIELNDSDSDTTEPNMAEPLTKGKKNRRDAIKDCLQVFKSAGERASDGVQLWECSVCLYVPVKVTMLQSEEEEESIGVYQDSIQW